jgi:GntR family transcriptional regulator/MocR family aminotransferase
MMAYLGLAMSLPRRMALLAWAERHGAAIIEDDYDTEFRYSGRLIEPVQTLDQHGQVLYVGSFSKTMLATLRLGFVVVPEPLVEAVRAAKFVADWHTSLPTQAALAGSSTRATWPATSAGCVGSTRSATS